MLFPENILGEQGALSLLIDDFAPRRQQLAMADAIEQAIADAESFICEAGTGTGKTFAYLVPAILSGQKVIISTGTRHLQDQLFAKDLPLVCRAIDRPVHVALLKGRANYLCLHRLGQVQDTHRYLDAASHTQLVDIRTWAEQTTHGELSELKQIPENTPLRPLITSTTDNCLGQACDHFRDCFVFKARKQAAEADVTVVNHHLFFADMTLKESGYGELLPAAEVIVLDEAHQLPELASEFFSQSLSSWQMLALLGDSRAAYYEEAADLPDFLACLDNMEKAIGDLRLAFAQPEGRLGWREAATAEVKQALQGLMDKTFAVQQLLQAFANRGKALDHCYKRIEAVLTMLDDFNECSSNTAPLIQWLELRRKGFLLHQTPLDIASTFQQRLADYDCLMIYTSATLTVNTRFDHFANQLGLSNTRARAWESPFDFANQALLYLPTGLADPHQQNYTQQVVEAALPVLTLTRGRAFFLFTSHRALRLAAELLAGQMDYPLLVQGDAPRTELLAQFRTSRHSVLLGTSSFWEGVDVKGQALSCVIIDKLPFAAPGDPVLRARMQHLEQQGINPFMAYQLPEAVISLKQGIGRLLRDQRDYGVLMICDPRLSAKSYGEVFLRSLPPVPRCRDLQDVAQFFRRHEAGQA